VQTASPSSPASTASSVGANETGLIDADASRGERFTIMQREAMKNVSPDELSAALPKAFAFPTLRDDAIFGIDVSHHNTDNCDCDIDWKRVADQKVAFVYVKSSEGTRSSDSKFASHWAKLAKIPSIHRGAYHFLSADDDIEAQVDFYLKKIMPLQANDLPPAMDLEWDIYPNGRKFSPVDRRDYWANIPANEIIARALKWLELVEQKTGRTPVIYTCREWWRERIGDESKFELFKRYPLWLSAMSDANLRLENPNAGRAATGAWGGWDIWQFTKMGDLTSAGVKLPRDPRADRWDVSIVPGTLSDFQKKMGIVPTVAVADASTSTSAGKDAAREPAKDNPAGEAAKDQNQQAAAKPGSDKASDPAKDANATPAKKRRPPRTPKSPAATDQPSTNRETESAGKPSDTPVAKNDSEPSTQPMPVDRNPETDNTGKPGDPSVAPEPQVATTTPQEPPKEKQAETSASQEPAKEKQADATPLQEPVKEKQADATPAQEPVKDKQADTTPAQEPAKDKQADAAPPQEPAKDAQQDAPKDSQVTAEGDKSKPADATPVAPSSTTVASNEPPKDTTTAATTPSEPAKDAATPSPSASNDPPKIIRMPSADGTAGTSAEPSVGTNPSATSPVPSAEPPQPTPPAIAPETTAAKPDDTPAATKPSTGDAAAPTPPKEPSTSTAAGGDAGKTAEAPTTTSPATGTTIVAANEPPKSAPPKNPAVTPAEAPKDTAAAKPETPPAANDAKGNKPAAGAATETVASASTDSQKPMMEIVLKNGRVLRVETDTDPDKLLRLIALLEQS
jgi:lysozyme